MAAGAFPAGALSQGRRRPSRPSARAPRARVPGAAGPELLEVSAPPPPALARGSPGHPGPRPALPDPRSCRTRYGGTGRREEPGSGTARSRAGLGRGWPSRGAGWGGRADGDNSALQKWGWGGSRGCNWERNRWAVGLQGEGDREPVGGSVLGIAGRAKDGEIDTSWTRKGGLGRGSLGKGLQRPWCM